MLSTLYVLYGQIYRCYYITDTLLLHTITYWVVSLILDSFSGRHGYGVIVAIRSVLIKHTLQAFWYYERVAAILLLQMIKYNVQYTYPLCTCAHIMYMSIVNEKFYTYFVIMRQVY